MTQPENACTHAFYFHAFSGLALPKVKNNFQKKCSLKVLYNYCSKNKLSVVVNNIKKIQISISILKRDDICFWQNYFLKKPNT